MAVTMFPQPLRVLLTALLLAGLPLLAQAQVLVSADPDRPDHPAVKAQLHLAKLVAERSQGAISVQVKPNAELGRDAEVLSRLRAGQLAMGRVSLTALADRVPAARLMNLPYLFRSRDHLSKVLAGDFGTRLDNEISASGVVVLAYYDAGARSFYARKPLRTRADFAGLKVAAPALPVYRDLLTELGGSPSDLTADRIGEALRSGELDAADGTLLAYLASEHYKFARHLSLDEHAMMPDVLLMSRRAWAALNAANQELVRGAAVESAQVQTQLMQDREREVLAQLRKSGVIVYNRSQLAMSGIESTAVRLYNRYVPFGPEMDTLLQIVSGN